jgi:hypothetical protein
VTKYVVTAATGFGKHKQGDEFEADLDPGLEQRAIARGSIKPVNTKPKAKKKEGSDA